MEDCIRKLVCEVMGREIQNIQLIKQHENRFIWQLTLSSDDFPSEKIIVKAISPVKRNVPEIKLYKNCPSSIALFLPEIYGFRKTNKFFYFLMENLENPPPLKMSIEFFKKPIEMLARLHKEFYSETRAIKSPRLNWLPSFQKEWRRRMDEKWLRFQICKNRNNSKVYNFLEGNLHLLKKMLAKTNESLKILLGVPHSIIHGEARYNHILYSSNNKNPYNARFIDWSNVSFAPVTLDLYFLIDKTFYHKVNPDIKFEEPYLFRGLDQNEELSSFRSDCLKFYCKTMKNYGIDIEEKQLQNWYNFTYNFKTARFLFWEKFRKLKGSH